MKIPALHPALVLLLAVLAAGAHAQYVWLDENGRRQYSDQPPPPSVPPERILRQGSAPAGAPAKAEEGMPAAPSLTERDAQFRQRRLEKAEQERKLREEVRAAAQKRKQCEQLRQYQDALESGQRLARRNANGEREFLSDDERRRELKNARRMLAECK